MALTQKQEKFCQNIVSGMTGIDSYMAAYDCNSKGAANVESTKLMKRDDITERIAELNRPILNLFQNKAISERQKQIDYIHSRIAICESNNDEASIIRYTDMLNKLFNLYKETEQTSDKENNIDSLDISALQKLSGIA